MEDDCKLDDSFSFEGETDSSASESSSSSSIGRIVEVYTDVDYESNYFVQQSDTTSSDEDLFINHSSVSKGGNFNHGKGVDTSRKWPKHYQCSQ